MCVSLAIGERWRVTLPPGALFRHSTVAALAAKEEDLPAGGHQEAATPLRPTTTRYAPEGA